MTTKKAGLEGVDPATLCAKYHAIHKEIYDWFRIDFEYFGQTSTTEHTEIVQDIFTELWNKEFIEGSLRCAKRRSLFALFRTTRRFWLIALSKQNVVSVITQAPAVIR